MQVLKIGDYTSKFKYDNIELDEKFEKYSAAYGFFDPFLRAIMELSFESF